MKTITLVYHCNVGLRAAADLVAKLDNTAVPVDNGQLALLDLALASDVTITDGAHVVKRTIALQTTPALDATNPTDDALIALTKELMSGALSQAGPSTVVADDPVVT